MLRIHLLQANESRALHRRLHKQLERDERNGMKAATEQCKKEKNLQA